MKIHLAIPAAMFLGLASVSYAAVIPETVSSDLHLPPGNHSVLTSSHVLPNVTLMIDGPSTVAFFQVSSTLRISGSLIADNTVFTGDALDDKWGQIWCNPGSSCNLSGCVIDNGGGNSLPPPPFTNAMLLAISADVIISNSIATRPKGDCFGFQGGSILFVDNVATAAAPGYGFYNAVHILDDISTPLYWKSSGNSLEGFPHQGIWVDGYFDKNTSFEALNGDKLHFSRVNVTNALITFKAGTHVGFSDVTHRGILNIWQGGTLHSFGNSMYPITFIDFVTNDSSHANTWDGINLYKGTTGLFVWSTIARSNGPEVNSGILTLSNSVVVGRSNYGIVSSNSSVYTYKTTISKFIDGPFNLIDSYAYLRDCSFIDNNPPYAWSLKPDANSVVDARYCWWNASDGPAPYGFFWNEGIKTNDYTLAFPWLSVPPGSQTNPPSIWITSHASEPVYVSEPTILLSGIVTDNDAVDYIEYRNLNSSVIGRASLFDGTNWHAKVWLFEGENQIGLYAYDIQGNVTPVGIVVNCTGQGTGDGGVSAPRINQVANTSIPEDAPYSITLVAASPTEPAILTYWADLIPDNAKFDQVSNQFTWQSPQAGVYSNVIFIVTDGTYVATNQFMITVVYGDPELSIRTVSLPPAYNFNTYFVMLTADNAVGPVAWSYSDINAPDGITLSRAGIISGVPYETLGQSFSFNATATDSRGEGFAAVKRFTLTTINDDPPDELRIKTQELPFTVTGTMFSATVVATNGYPGYLFSDGGATLNMLGLRMDQTGNISGEVTSDSTIPFTSYVQDQSNLSAFANIAVSSIPPENQLVLKPGMNKLKLKVVNVPLKEAKSAYILKTVLLPPAGFTFDDRSIVTCMVGVNQIDGNLLVSSVPDKKLLFKQKKNKTLEKIKIVKTGTGEIKASFVLKNSDLTHSFTKYGMLNEDAKGKTITIPVWIKIGDYSIATENVPVTVNSKVSKTAKGSAKW